MWYKWGTRDWTLSTKSLTDGPDLPRTDLRYFFDNERLIRMPVQQYVPWVTTPALRPIYPVLNFANCNWTGPLFGAGETVFNMRWHLAYVQNITAFNGGISAADNAESLAGLIQTCQVSTPLDDTDSHTESGGDPDPDTGIWADPGDAKGWVLCLMHYDIKGGDPEYRIEWHCYAAYQLHPDNQLYLSSTPSTVVVPDPIVSDADGTSPSPMFNCLDRNTWIPIHNPLNFPAHLIQTRPIGP